MATRNEAAVSGTERKQNQSAQGYTLGKHGKEQAALQPPAIPGPGQVTLILDGQQNPMFILPAEMPVDDQRALTAEESKALATAKATLVKHGDALQQVAEAIYRVHTGRLYRETHSTLAGFLLTFCAFRPVTWAQVETGKVPVELSACLMAPLPRPRRSQRTTIRWPRPAQQRAQITRT